MIKLELVEVLMENTYKSEEEFLKNYDPNQFERLSLTTDILIVSVSDVASTNYRKSDQKNMSILLVKRNDYPFKDKWCLPGGFIRMNENLRDCPVRILKDETNLHDIYLEQLYTFGEVNRDPRMRIISTSYMALVDKNKLLDKLKENASWFNVSIDEDKDIVTINLDNGNVDFNIKIKKILKEKTTDRYRYEVIDNNYLAFDHAKVILTGLNRLKNKIEYTDIVFNMMPKYFTLGELQRVYEVILGKKLLDPAFRRIIKNKVIKTEKIKSDGGHRPSYLYMYNEKK